MSKKVVTPQELKQMLARDPWHSVQVNYDQQEHLVIIETALTHRLQVPLVIAFSDTMVLDGRRHPICPLDGIAIPRLSDTLQVPTITPQTPLLFGKWSIYAVAGNGSITYRFDLDAPVEQMTHFMTIERRRRTIAQKEAGYYPAQDWQPISLRGITQEFTDPVRVMQAISQFCDEEYWIFTAYPIGYCWPKATLAGFYVEDADGRYYTESVLDQLVPYVSGLTREYYQEAIYAREAEAEEEARHIQYQQTNLTKLCRSFSERINQLRSIAGFEELSDEFRPLSDGNIQRGSTIYTVTSIEQLVSRLELKAARYQEFHPQIEALRSRIVDAYGELVIDNTDYATVNFQVHVFAEATPGWASRRFRYSIVGYTELLKWLVEQEGIVSKAEAQLIDS